MSVPYEQLAQDGLLQIGDAFAGKTAHNGADGRAHNRAYRSRDGADRGSGRCAASRCAHARPDRMRSRGAGDGIGVARLILFIDVIHERLCSVISSVSPGRCGVCAYSNATTLCRGEVGRVNKERPTNFDSARSLRPILFKTKEGDVEGTKAAAGKGSAAGRSIFRRRKRCRSEPRRPRRSR